MAMRHTATVARMGKYHGIPMLLHGDLSEIDCRAQDEKSTPNKNKGQRRGGALTEAFGSGAVSMVIST